MIRLLFCVALLVSVTACESFDQEQKRGYALEFARIDEINVGASTKEDVLKALGSPSSTSMFGEETWYYIGLKVKKGPLDHGEIDQQHTLTVKFDEHGVVSEFNQVKGEQRRDIMIADDDTPTEGNEITVIQQLLGNLGRFNSPQGGGGRAQPRGPAPF